MVKKATKEEFLEAYNQYADAIFRYCFYKTSNREKALDLVQDTYVKAWNYLKSGKKINNLKAFLYKTANNLIIDYFRKKKMTSLDQLTEAGFDPPFDKREEMFDKLDGELALKAVDLIEPIYREVIIMRYVEELSIKEIAKKLKEKENNISVRLHRGMGKLKKVLSQYETP
jgi:RNA polymerase sigma-70 factor (ECF subfamily)